MAYGLWLTAYLNSMLLAIDLGGSTVDLIVFGPDKKIAKTYSFESAEIDRSDILGILKRAKIETKRISALRITGGFSLRLPQKIAHLKIEQIPEFDANGFGGQFLARTKSALVVSLGTGTSMVKVIHGKIQHIGGTGIGGGTLIGLGKLLLNETNYHKIDQLAQKGDLKKIDLSVKDIVGGDIGILPGTATASNFGKMQKYTRADLALGICNLIGETVGSIAYFASKKYNLDDIVLIGKVTRVKSILKIIQTTSKVYNKKIIIPEMADFGTAIGAGLINRL